MSSWTTSSQAKPHSGLIDPAYKHSAKPGIAAYKATVYGGLRSHPSCTSRPAVKARPLPLNGSISCNNLKGWDKPYNRNRWDCSQPPPPRREGSVTPWPGGPPSSLHCGTPGGGPRGDLGGERGLLAGEGGAWPSTHIPPSPPSRSSQQSQRCGREHIL